MVPADSDRIPRAPPYSGATLQCDCLPVPGCHRLRRSFPEASGSDHVGYRLVLQPRIVLKRRGLGSSLFDRHYWGNRLFLSSPPGTKMFQFPGFAPSIDGTGSSIQWVAPFGYGRINSCLPIPGLFRSLPRPSSPAEAKASSVRPASLSLMNLCLMKLYYLNFLS